MHKVLVALILLSISNPCDGAANWLLAPTGITESDKTGPLHLLKITDENQLRILKWSLSLKIRAIYHDSSNILGNCAAGIMMHKRYEPMIDAIRIKVDNLHSQICDIVDSFTDIHDDVVFIPNTDIVALPELLHELSLLYIKQRGLISTLSELEAHISESKYIKDIKKDLEHFFEPIGELLHSVDDIGTEKRIDLNKVIRHAAAEHKTKQSVLHPYPKGLLRFNLSRAKKVTEFPTHLAPLWADFFVIFLDNALRHGFGFDKFTLEETGHIDADSLITITTTPVKDGVIITIEDNGTGTADEARTIVNPVTGKQKLFLREYSTSGDTTKTPHGMGLSICWDIAKLHGGFIRATPTTSAMLIDMLPNVKNPGTRFNIFLRNPSPILPKPSIEPQNISL